MDVEKEIFDPYCAVCCAIVRFDVYGFEPFWEFMIHHFISEAEGVCGASVSGYVATQFELVWVAVFGPAGLVYGVSVATVIVACWGAPPRSIDRSWLSCFVFQYILRVLPVAPGRSVLAWGCGLVFGLICRFITAMGWPVSEGNMP